MPVTVSSEHQRTGTVRQSSKLTLKLWVLLTAGTLTTMAGGVVAPVFPDMVDQLQITSQWTGILVSIHCLTIALFSLPLGILADRFGAVRVLVPSLVSYALFGLMGAWIEDFWPLLLTRALLGAASGGIVASGMGLLSNMYEGEARSRALGYATSVLSISGIAYPLLGGLVGAIHWHYAFYLYGIGLPFALLVAVVFRHYRPGVAKSGTPASPQSVKLTAYLRQHLLNPYPLTILLALALTSVAMYAVVIYAPFYLRTEIGASTTVNGVVLAMRAIGAAAVSALGLSWLTRRLGANRAISLGCLLMAITLGTIPLLQNLGWIVVMAILFGAGFGTVLPSLYDALANVAPAHLRSSILALGTGAGFLGQFLSPILLAPVLGWGGLANVFYAAAGIAFATSLLILGSRNPAEC